MKKLLASVLCFALAIAAAPINLIAQTNGAISGVASVDGKPLANTTVRLRNVDTGQLVGNTTSNAQGQFSFTGLGPGNFVVETVAANGTILGTSAAIALTAAAMTITGITVSTSAAAIAAAGGAAAGVAGTAGAVGGGAALGTGLSTTLITVLAVGGGLGITAGIIAANNDASPSR